MYGALDVSTSALVAQRIRMDTIAGNVANHGTAARPDGKPGPYQRRVPIFAAGNPAEGKRAPGVHVAEIVKDPSPPSLRYEPEHPLANDKGYVAYPNVNLAVEMVNAVEAARAYEANITVIGSTKNMISVSLKLLA